MEKNNFCSNCADLQKKLKGVVDYIEENPNSEPNAYEMMDNLFDYYRLRKQALGKEDNCVKEVAKLYHKVMAKRMPQLRSYDYIDGMLYNIFNSVITKGEIDGSFNNILGESYEAQDLFRRLFGVDFYIRQRVRDLNNSKPFPKDAIVYDNHDEFEALRKCFFDSKYTDSDVNLDVAVRVMEHIAKAYDRTIYEFNELQKDDCWPFSQNEKYR